MKDRDEFWTLIFELQLARTKEEKIKLKLELLKIIKKELQEENIKTE